MTDTTPTRIAIVSAGLGDPSTTTMLATRLGAATQAALADAGRTATVDAVELRPLAHDIATHLVTRVASPELDDAIRRVTSADAIVAVTPVFTMSYSGLFKSFIDGIGERELAGIPTLLGATGGTVRHSMVVDTALRPLFAYLGSVVAPTGVFAATEDWGQDAALQSRIDRAGRELARLVLQMPRAPKTDPFDPEGGAFDDFASLLGR
ncbi:MULTISPECIES: CE1759 family FMN reductase [unclassified Agrococcus]|uniref:CE1759 family FMN reductase n=1 Tax=unclassified Agrococcus TaxID=2615065 RepID=UPI00361429E4